MHLTTSTHNACAQVHEDQGQGEEVKERGEEEEEAVADGDDEVEEAVCVECGTSPCVFAEAVEGLVAFGIDWEWLDDDFNFSVENDQDRAEACAQNMVEDTDDLQGLIECQHHYRYEMYWQYTLAHFGPGCPCTIHPNCVNRGICRINPAPHLKYHGPLAKWPQVLPDECPE